MTKEQLWEKYVAKNPAFGREGNVTLSAKGLKKFFDQVYDKGHERGVRNGRALEVAANKGVWAWPGKPNNKT